MIFLKKVNGLVLGLAVLLAVGCSSDDPEPENINNQTQTQEKCLVTKSYSPGSNPNNVIIENFYDSNKRLIKQHDFTYAYILYEYDATGLIVTRNYYQKSDSTLSRYDISEYNQNGLLTKRTDFGRSAGSQTITESGTMIQDYNGANQLVKRSYYSAANKVTPHHFSNYTYLPNGSIKEEMYETQNNTLVLFMTSFWEFDNKNRAVSSANLKEGFGVGKGNVVLNTDIDANSSDTTIYQFSYQYNADNYPIQSTATVTSNSSSYSYSTLFEYNCQ